MSIVTDPSGRVAYLSPGEPIDWSDTDLPELVRASMQEAIDCHSVGAYRAAGAMIRLTAEEITRQELSANDFEEFKSLHGRLRHLAKINGIPADLVDGLVELKLLGNDSIHPIAKDFDPTQDNVELAFEIVKHTVQVLYQQKALVAKLSARKKS